MVKRADFAFSQDLSTLISKQRNTLQFRLDILNVGNLINSDWGVGQRLVTNTPLVIGSGRPTADSQGRAVYRLRAINNQLISKSLEATNSFADVYRLQFGFRYLFN
jgi:hypothetical protein